MLSIFVPSLHLHYFLVVADKPSSRKKRIVFDLPAPVNYNKDFTIETLVVADKTMTDFHGIEELKVYVPSLVNIVSLMMFVNFNRYESHEKFSG